MRGFGWYRFGGWRGYGIPTSKVTETTLWTSPTAQYEDCIRRRYVATLARFFGVAAVTAEMDITEDEIFLTETNSGRLGPLAPRVAAVLRHSNEYWLGKEQTLFYGESASVRGATAGSVVVFVDLAMILEMGGRHELSERTRYQED